MGKKVKSKLLIIFMLILINFSFILCIFSYSLSYAYTPPLGIPNPSWGNLHPIDTPAPAQPTGWPSSEVVGYYYINGSVPCSDSNKYGYPEKPRCSFKNGTYPAGTYVEFHGSVINTMQTTFLGTIDNPCWIIGRPDDPPVFSSSGRIILTDTSYTFVDGLEFSNKSRNAILVDNSDSGGVSHHISIRNINSHDFDYVSSDAVISVTARGVGKVHDVIVYNTLCERVGQSTATEDTDLHCAVFGLRLGDQTTAEAYNLWWLNNECNDNGGSGIQVNGWVDGQPNLHNVYLGNNTGRNNRQRMIGVKQSSHVIVSQNNYLPGQDCGSAGCVSETFGWALSPDYVWFLFNTVYEASDGWRASDSSGGTSSDTRIYIIGNKIYNIKPNDKMERHDPTNMWRYGQGVDLKNGYADVYIVDNTFYNVYGGVLKIREDNPMHIYGNIFVNIYPLDTFIEWAGNADPNLDSSDYNTYYEFSGNPRWRVMGETYTNLSSFSNSTNFDKNSIFANPLFVDQDNYDFRLLPDSPSINTNKSSRYVYDLFYNLYGINIKYDFNGIPRPQGAGWDMGAFEFVEKAPKIEGSVIVTP